MKDVSARLGRPLLEDTKFLLALLIAATAPAWSQAPTLTSFSPTSGTVGTTVVLTGTNLTGAYRAAIGDVIMTPTNVTATSATVVIPSGASTNTFAIRTPIGVADSSTDFTVIMPPPTITSFAPTSGPVGTSVVLTGTNFTGAYRAAIGDVIMTPTNVMDTSATVVIPAGATTNTFALRTPGGVADSATEFTVTSTTIRINAGGGAYTDSANHLWIADTDYSGGSVISTTSSPMIRTITS